MLQIKDTISPHEGQKIIYAGSGVEDADTAMILLHGRGADAESMKGVVSEIYMEGMTYVIPQATNYTWYPRRFIEKREVNEPGISSGLTLIESIINALIERNIRQENIYVLGFSQGACLATDFMANHQGRFGGLFALSGGLIGDELNMHDYQGDLEQTPVFFGCSDRDLHIPEERIHESARIFENLNANVTKRLYPDMGHTISLDELYMIKKNLKTKQIAR
jgi:phospholipase/carboxylesterase